MMKSDVCVQVPEQQVLRGEFKAVGLKALWAKVRKVVWLWYQRDRQRHELARLSPAMLKDIGLSRSDALQEYAKPFWKE